MPARAGALGDAAHGAIGEPLGPGSPVAADGAEDAPRWIWAAASQASNANTGR